MNMKIYISLSIAKPFQSNQPKTLLSKNWLQLYEWKNVDSDLMQTYSFNRMKIKSFNKKSNQWMKKIQ